MSCCGFLTNFIKIYFTEFYQSRYNHVTTITIVLQNITLSPKSPFMPLAVSFSLHTPRESEPAFSEDP